MLANILLTFTAGRPLEAMADGAAQCWGLERGLEPWVVRGAPGASGRASSLLVAGILTVLREGVR